jgi:hypothetical protein
MIAKPTTYPYKAARMGAIVLPLLAALRAAQFYARHPQG